MVKTKILFIILLLALFSNSMRLYAEEENHQKKFATKGTVEFGGSIGFGDIFYSDFYYNPNYSTGHTKESFSIS